MNLRIDNRIVAAMALYFTVLFGCFLANNAALSIFLCRVGVKLFPMVFIINAFFMIAMTCVYSLFADRVNNFKITYIFFAVDILALIVMRAWLTVSSFYAPFVLYVLVTTIVNYAVIQFWAMSDNVFSFMESKRFYSLVGAGGTMGTVLAGFLSKHLAHLLHTENLIILCAVTMSASIALVRLLQRYQAGGLAAADKKLDVTRVFRDVTDGFVYVARSRMFFLLSLCIFILYVLNFGIEYFYSDLVARHFKQEDQITAFVGFWLGVLNLITLIIQFFFASKVISFFGVGVTGVIGPITMFASYLFLAASYTLPAGVFARIVPASVRFSLGNPVINIICYLADEKARVKVRAFMNILVASLGMLTAGVLLNAVVKKADAQVVHALCLGLFGLSCVLIVLSFMLKNSYRANIFRLLQSQDRTSLISYLNQIECSDRDLNTVLVRSLEGARDEDAVLVMDLLLKTGFSDRKKIFATYYGTFAPPVKCKFISCLGCVRDVELIERAADRFLFEPEDVQLGMLKVADLCNIAIQSETLRGVLRSENIEVRIYAAKLLYKAGDGDGKKMLSAILGQGEVTLEKIELVKIWHDMAIDAVGALTAQLLTAGPDEMRKAVLGSMRAVKQQEVVDRIALLFASGTRLDKEIFKLMERTLDPRFMQVLIDLLASPVRSRRTWAARILIRYRGIPQAVLLEKLSASRDSGIQLAYAEVLSSLKGLAPDAAAVLLSASQAKIKDVYGWYLAKNMVMAMRPSDARDLLAAAFDEKIRSGITLILAAAALIKEDTTISLIHRSLFAADRKRVDHALESLFLLKDDEVINLLIPITYEPYAGRVEKIAEKEFQMPRRSEEQTLRDLLASPDDWIRISALNLIRTLPDRGRYAAMAGALAGSTNEIERELAAVV